MNPTLWLLAIIGLIIGFFIVIFSLLLRERQKEDDLFTGGGPLGILYDRYVKREITIDQYQDMRKELEAHSPENTVENFSRYL